MRKESRSSFEITFLNDRAEVWTSRNQCNQELQFKTWPVFPYSSPTLTFTWARARNSRNRKPFSVHYKYFSPPLSRVSDRLMHNVEKDIRVYITPIYTIRLRIGGPSVDMFVPVWPYHCHQSVWFKGRALEKQADKQRCKSFAYCLRFYCPLLVCFGYLAVGFIERQS